MDQQPARPYEIPSLSVLGDVRDLTLGGTGAVPDVVLAGSQ